MHRIVATLRPCATSGVRSDLLLFVLTMDQVLSHQYKIASKIELFVWDEQDPSSDGNYQRLGQVIISHIKCVIITITDIFPSTRMSAAITRRGNSNRSNCRFEAPVARDLFVDYHAAGSGDAYEAGTAPLPHQQVHRSNRTPISELCGSGRYNHYSQVGVVALSLFGVASTGRPGRYSPSFLCHLVLNETPLQ